MNEVQFDESIKQKIDEIHEAIIKRDDSLRFIMEAYQKALEVFTKIEETKNKFRLSKAQFIFGVITFISGSALTFLYNYWSKGGG